MAHRRGGIAPPRESGLLGQTDLGRWFVVERVGLGQAIPSQGGDLSRRSIIRWVRVDLGYLEFGP